MGMALGTFNTLARIWKHCSLSRRRKLEIFNAVVVSKLVYGLNTAWLNVAERRRLDDFQNRCLRKILNIAPAFISRIANVEVLTLGSQTPLSRTLQEQQVQMY